MRLGSTRRENRKKEKKGNRSEKVRHHNLEKG
jgi:hypothetical protein